MASNSAPSARGKLVVAVLTVSVLALDLWSKSAIFASFAEQPVPRVRWVLGEWLGVTHTLNKGVMWGKFPQLAEMLPYLRSVAALIVAWMALTTPAGARRILWALGLVLGGALGNIYDGFALGAVRDFILVDFDIKYFDPFPIFNVADSAICVGVGLLAIGLMAADGEESEDGAVAKDDDGARADAS